MRTTNQEPEWLANLPELNTNENVWKVTDTTQKKYARPMKNREMKQALHCVWEEFPAAKLEAQVASMPERIIAVLKAKGEHIYW